MLIGDNIRKYRKEKGFTQKDLAKKLGVSQQMIGQYENNKNPKIETVERIAIALNISLSQLLPDELVSEIKDQEFIKACEYLEEANFTIEQDEKDIERGVYQICHPDYGTVTVETRDYILNLIQRIVKDSLF